MSVKAFLATTGDGVAYAKPGTGGTWSVEMLLPEQDVRCLAVDPLDPAVVYAGTQGHGVLRSTDRGKTWHPAGLAGHTRQSSGCQPYPAGNDLCRDKTGTALCLTRWRLELGGAPVVSPNPLTLVLVLTRRNTLYRLCTGDRALAYRPEDHGGRHRGRSRGAEPGWWEIMDRPSPGRATGLPLAHLSCRQWRLGV